jgi:uncharacterized protein (DUF983 family)
MFTGTKIYSILAEKCPRCHQGNLFVNKNPYQLRNWGEMHENCSHCELKYELEPGFFQGAMYVSYGLGVAQSVALLIFYWIVFEFDPLWFFIINTVALIVMAPILFRMARAIYLNLFVKYRKDLSNKE